tara:strand:+ start:1098 stop:1331 length:234 start_codon:yes stop_codon:yes gene_type:complete
MGVQEDMNRIVFNWELANKIDDLEKKIDELTKTINTFWEYSTAKSIKTLQDTYTYQYTEKLKKENLELTQMEEEDVV